MSQDYPNLAAVFYYGRRLAKGSIHTKTCRKNQKVELVKLKADKDQEEKLLAEKNSMIEKNGRQMQEMSEDMQRLLIADKVQRNLLEEKNKVSVSAFV